MTGNLQHIIRAAILTSGIALFLSACERFREMPVPETVPEGAEYDRRIGLWSHRSAAGEYTLYYSDGKTALKGQYQNGNRTGIWRTFSPYDQGNIVSEGSYVNDWRDGVWKFNDDSGAPYLTVAYAPEPKRTFGLIVTHDYGNENGPYRLYYPDGTLQEEGNYHSGYLQGRFRRYHPNGKIQIEGTYDKDEKTGNWTYYYPEGRIEKTVEYRKNTFHGVFRVFYPDGRLYNEAVYENGNLKSGPVIHPVSGI